MTTRRCCRSCYTAVGVRSTTTGSCGTSSSSPPTSQTWSIGSFSRTFTYSNTLTGNKFKQWSHFRVLRVVTVDKFNCIRKYLSKIISQTNPLQSSTIDGQSSFLQNRFQRFPRLRYWTRQPFRSEEAIVKQLERKVETRRCLLCHQGFDCWRNQSKTLIRDQDQKIVKWQS